MDILEDIQNMMIDSDHDEKQSYDVFETFVIVMVFDQEEGLNISINFDVWTKSLKETIIDEIPSQLLLLDNKVQSMS